LLYKIHLKFTKFPPFHKNNFTNILLNVSLKKILDVKCAGSNMILKTRNINLSDQNQQQAPPAYITSAFSIFTINHT